MFDLPPPIEQHCPQETVQLVIEIKPNDDYIDDMIFDLFNKPKWDPCRDSVLAFLFSTLVGTEDREYIRELLLAGMMTAQLTEETKNIIYEKVDIIPYFDDDYYAGSYFGFLIAFEIEPTEAIRNLHVSEDGPLWSKNRYLSYMGDWEAFQYILDKMRQEEHPNYVLLMSAGLNWHPVEMRQEILKTFQYDTRRLNRTHPEVPGRLLIDDLKMALED